MPPLHPLDHVPCHETRPQTHLGLAASNGTRTDGACLLVPAQDLRDTTVGHAQLAGDDARSNAMVGHLHDLVADVVG